MRPIHTAKLDKTGPVLILTREIVRPHLSRVTVAPITSTIRGLSTEVSVGPEDGIRAESVANLDNLQFVARRDLVRRIGRARQATLDGICKALSIASGCDR